MTPEVTSSHANPVTETFDVSPVCQDIDEKLAVPTTDPHTVHFVSAIPC